MNKEEIGITASKKDDFSEWYTQVVLKAELADYAPVKGLIVLRPSGYSIWESLKVSLDKKLALQGVSNGFLPILIPESLLGKEKKHFAGFDPEVFWVTHSGKDELGDRLALRPTSETLAYTMYAKWIKSWRDLPLRINFWNTALRAEIKATKPFLRTSEFLWQEGHTVHADSDEAKNETKVIMGIYKETVENELAIPVITGKKSEKEQFVGAVYTITMESMMPDGRALQMGTSHFLGQNFSKPFEVKYADKNNVEKFTWQTSWGVSWRLLGAMIMVHGDDHGLVLPPKVAPIQVVIIPIYYSKEDEKNVCSKAEQIRMEISKMGMRTHMDKREGMTRMSAPVSSFIASSHEVLPHHGDLKNPPPRRASSLPPSTVLNSSYVATSRMFSASIFFASSSISNWITSKVFFAVSAASFSGIFSLPPVLFANTATFSFKSLGPSSIRSGMPRISQS